MKAKKSFLVILCLLIISGLFSCKGPKQDSNEFTPTKQQKAEDAIKSWMFENNEYPHYKPIVFGDINARYERSDRTLQLMTMIEQEEALSKEEGNTEKLDSLKTLLNSNLGELLGYIMLHKFQSADLAGEPLEMECLFFLDTTFRVASVLSPESFDLILTEKVFFRIDPEN
jgi:hypothetical protein